MNQNDPRLGAYRKSMKKETPQDSPRDSGLLKVPGKKERESPYRRVAKFLLLIGTTEAAKIVSRLDPDQVEKVMMELSGIRSVPHDEATVILAEFESLLHQAKQSTGGVETARTILEEAFGSERAAEMLEKAVPNLHGKPFDYLQDIDSEKLYRLIRGELASVRALVLSQAKPSIAAEAIKRMDDTEKKDTVFRLARMGAVSPEVIRRVDDTMREKVETIEVPTGDTVDGRSALAAILKRMDGETEKGILGRLEDHDPELGRDIRNRLFTLDDLVHVDDKYLQGELRSLSDHDFAVLLAGKSPELRNKLLGNISRNRRTEILEEENIITPVTRKESRDVTEAFYTKVRNAWEAGTFRLSDDDDDQWVE